MLVPSLLPLNRFHTLFWCFFVDVERVNAGWDLNIRRTDTLLATSHKRAIHHIYLLRYFIKHTYLDKISFLEYLGKPV